MSVTLAGVIRKWTQDQAYDQLVNAEGLGMALRIRKALWLGPSAAWPLRKVLPPTASIGIGAYHALVAMVFGIPRKVPDDLLTNILNGWDAHLRLESFFFNLVLTRFVVGRTEENAALFRQLVAFAEADKVHGFALMVGLGRGCQFVIHDPKERLRTMNDFGELAPYARMGAGIPLINTVSDDIGRLPAAIKSYPDPYRRDVLAGMSLFLSFSTHFWGMEWLEQFGGMTPKLDQFLRDVDRVSDDVVRRYSPMSDLTHLKGALDDGLAELGPKIDEILKASGL
jgi:hypothetical protein